jgi:hypothetical protein
MWHNLGISLCKFPHALYIRDHRRFSRQVETTWETGVSYVKHAHEWHLPLVSRYFQLKKKQIVKFCCGMRHLKMTSAHMSIASYLFKLFTNYTGKILWSKWSSLYIPILIINWPMVKVRTDPVRVNGAK